MAYRRYFLSLLFICIVLSLFHPVHAQSNPTPVVITVDLSTSLGINIPISQVGESSNLRILWFLDEQSSPEQSITLAQQLAEQGMEIWLFSWPAELREVANTALTPTVLAEILSLSLPREGQKAFFLMAFGAAVNQSLYALHPWQAQQASDAKQLAGLIFAYPEFDAKQFTVPLQATPPTYIFQPERSERNTQLNQLVDYLEHERHSVYVQHVKDTQDGYLERAERSGDEWMQSAIFPAEVQQALARLKQTVSEPVPVPGAARGAEKALQTYGNVPAPTLVLEDLDRDMHDLSHYKGKVVVLNFWATWCPPCVKELPALDNLQKRFSMDDLRVLGVDIGEPPDVVAAFLDHVNVDYPILLDAAGATPSAWVLRAFPTTLIIDQHGMIRMGYEGDLEWDSDEVVQTIEKAFGIKAIR